MTNEPATQTRRSALYRLIEAKLGKPLDEYLLNARKEQQGFNHIAFRLYREVGIPLTHEAVRRWVRDLESEREITPSYLPGHGHHSITTFDEPAA